MADVIVKKSTTALTKEQQLVVTDNIRLAHYIAEKYRATVKNLNYIDMDDMTDAAFLGLVKAASSFKPKLGFKFATYAVQIMHNECRMQLRSNKRLGNLIQVSLDVEVRGDADSEEIHLSDIIPDPHKAFDELPIFTKALAADLNAAFYASIQSLNGETQEMLLYWWTEGVLKSNYIRQEDLAAKFNTSQSWVSRVLRKIRKRLSDCIKL